MPEPDRLEFESEFEFESVFVEALATEVAPVELLELELDEPEEPVDPPMEEPVEPPKLEPEDWA
jgi:hypothetical protein